MKEQNVWTPVPAKCTSKIFHNHTYLWYQIRMPSQVGK